MTVPVQKWWENRHQLNEKMALTLRNEFAQMLTKAELTIFTQAPAFGKACEEIDRRNQALLDDLRAKITEMDQILKKF
jgi:hypothetical protein